MKVSCYYYNSNIFWYFIENFQLFLINSYIGTQKRKTRSKNPTSSTPARNSTETSKVVLTVTRCGGWENYVGQRIIMNIPKTFPKQKKLSKKSADSVLFIIGADEECDFSFENDGYMSSR